MRYNQRRLLKETKEMLETSIALGDLENVSLIGVDMLDGSTILSTVELQTTPTEEHCLVASSNIMGHFNGYRRQLKRLKIHHVATRIKIGEETCFEMISATDGIAQLGQGNALGWRQSSTIIDNTENTRLYQAKRYISAIEQTLRKVIEHRLTQGYGVQFWQTATQNIKNANLPKQAQQYPDAQKLEYTYLHHLRDLILENWPLFQDLFTHPTKISDWYDILNPIRRNEAHNRSPSRAEVDTLRTLQSEIFTDIASQHPELVEDFLFECWRDFFVEEGQRIDRLTLEQNKKLEEIRRTKPSLVGATVIDFADQRAQLLEDFVESLRSFTKSPSQAALQEEAEALFETEAQLRRTCHQATILFVNNNSPTNERLFAQSHQRLAQHEETKKKVAQRISLTGR